MPRIIQFQYVSEDTFIVLDDDGILWCRDSRGIWSIVILPPGLDPDYEEEGDAQC